MPPRTRASKKQRTIKKQDPAFEVHYKDPAIGMVRIKRPICDNDFWHFVKKAVGDISLEGTFFRPIDIEALDHKLEFERKRGRWTQWDKEIVNGREIITIFDGDNDIPIGAYDLPDIDRLLDDDISLVTMDMA